jgi:flagella basal body P-ring formation protein FlgA
MKYDKWICLTLLAGMLFCIGSASRAETLDRTIIKGIIDYYDLGAYDIEIDIRSNRLRADSTDFDSLTVEPLTRGEPRGLLSFKVFLFKEGTVSEEGQVRVKIEYYQDVMVTTDRIRRHQPVTPDKVTIKRMETTSLTVRPLTLDDNISGMWAKRDIRKNQIVSSSLIEKIPAVQTGQGVAILYKTAGLEITARGAAMENGHVGEKIKVQNNQSNKVISCVVLNNEIVQVIGN